MFIGFYARITFRHHVFFRTKLYNEKKKKKKKNTKKKKNNNKKKKKKKKNKTKKKKQKKKKQLNVTSVCVNNLLSDLYTNHSSTSPTCSYSKEVEDADHYFFSYSNFNNERDELLQLSKDFYQLNIFLFSIFHFILFYFLFVFVFCLKMKV